MTATLNVVVSINSTTVMQTYWTASCPLAHVATLASGFKSRLGFILMSAGCAIGCGNVWKFPWMVGKMVAVYFSFYMYFFQ